ncbi:major facilitator superfamily domain-containing protein [Clohesyomyces aquaticus]|uniref:Major facilitator superfamily domain-containing protein n=1 Tax=Clohesyomyces aquaticus TaxID=1231657 RepID=A0A1Y1ZLE3_9PLEO|nr:major facilitator superfamily domain-containing protein [Clohesyomyces aquaticus]
MDIEVASSTDSSSYTKIDAEGGPKGWLTVAGSFLVYYSSFGIINSFGFFQKYYQEDFLLGTPPSTIAFIGTLQLALMNLLSPISGSLCDSYGIKYLYIVSGLGTSCALLALSFASHGAAWLVFLLQGLLLGTIMAFAIQPALTVAGHHFRDKRAFAMGIVSTGSGVGGICYPIMMEKLVTKIGFAWAVRVAALKVVLCYTTALVISTSRPSCNVARLNFTSLLDMRGFLDPRYCVLAIAAFFCHLGLWGPSYYLNAYCATLHGPTPIQDYILPLLNATSVFGMILGGKLGDRIGRLNLLCPMIILAGLLSLLMWLLATPIAAIVTFACIYGYCTGHFIALLPAVVGQISPEEKLGARMGALYSVAALASLIGTPIGGALIKDSKMREGYQGLILYSGGALLSGGLILFVGRLLHKGGVRAKW